MAQQITFVMVPPLFLIFLVLGTIFIGLATPTEGGAMGATGALILAAVKGRLKFDLVRQATEATAKLSAFVVFILIGARVFSLTFYGVSGHVWVEELLTSLPGGQVGFLIFVNVFVFVLAFFLDFFELAFIIIPLLGPGGRKARHRPHLVRRDPRRQHADVVHASAVRLRAVLSAVGRADANHILDRVTKKTDGARHHRPNLLGRGAVRGDSSASWCCSLSFSRPWSCTTKAPASTVDPCTIKIEIRIPMAAAARFWAAENPIAGA